MDSPLDAIRDAAEKAESNAHDYAMRDDPFWQAAKKILNTPVKNGRDSVVLAGPPDPKADKCGTFGNAHDSNNDRAIITDAADETDILKRIDDARETEFFSGRKSLECIKRLEIRAHGIPNAMEIGEALTCCSDGLSVDFGDGKKRDTLNASSFGANLKSRMCKGNCEILLTACEQAQGDMPQQLADATGCTVKALKSCYYRWRKNRPDGCMWEAVSWDDIERAPGSYLIHKDDGGERAGDASDIVTYRPK